jgi:threonine aldolase
LDNLRVDLYSDTNTRPTPAMRKAIAEAAVGNEQAGEDPTVNRLCEMVAELVGKEAAVYTPSGSMCNEIAYRVWCRQGDEVILDRTAHAVHAETGAPAALSGLMLKTLDGPRGMFSAEQVRAAINPLNNHRPRSRLVSIEQTSNHGGGTIWSLAQIQAVAEVTRDNGLHLHMDGARLLNAVVESGISAANYATPFDSVWIDFSKGLGAPVGAVLAGPADFIAEAWRCKQQFGGAMRQAGIIAAACVYALEHNVERLAEDHENARHFAACIADIPGVRLEFDKIETNLVFFDVSGTGLGGAEIAERLRGRGVRIGVSAPLRMRAVTHLDASRADVELAANELRAVLAEK